MLSSMRHSRWFHRHAWLVVAPLIAVGIIGALLTRQTEPDLTILCSNKAEACEAVAHSFEAAQGVNALVVRVPTSQALAHISSPNARGEFDVWMGGPAEAYTQAAADGLLRPLASEPANSIPGRWKDPGRRWFGIYGGVLSLCVANDAVAPVSWDALIDPAYADAIAMPHPSTSGTAATILWSQVERLGSEDGARAYYRALEKNVGTYTTSGTFPAPIVAGGRLPLALTFDSYCLAERNAGKAVHPVYFADGVGFEIGSVGVLAGTTRPELAEVFVGYAISDEGQMVSAAASTQYPTSAALAGNLSTTLDAVAVPIFGEDIERAGAHRSELIATWERDRLGDSPYLEALPRSLVVALAAGLVSALAGMALALGYRFGRFRVITAMLAVTPFLLPPATWALALTYPPFGLDVDGTGVVILASAISSVPIGFAVSLLALSAVGDRHLIEARALGLPRSAIAARLVAPQAARGVLMATAVAGLLTLTDPTLTLVFGGTRRYFASEILIGMSTNRPGAMPAALAISCAIAALVSLPLSRALTARIRSVDPATPSPPAPQPWAGLLFALAVPLVALAWIVAANARRSASLSVTTTVAILLVVVTVALILAGLIVMAVPVRRAHLLVYPSLVLVLSAQTTGGVFVSALHSDWMELAGAKLVPPIVGVDSLYQGFLGVVLAYLLLVLPLAVLAMVIVRLDIRPFVAAMRDAGAYRLRLAGELLPIVWPTLTIAVALLTGLVLTRSAPAIFIDVGGRLALTPLAVQSQVAAAADGQAFGLSIIMSMLVISLLAVAGVLWIEVRRKRWRSSSTV
ncbi:hypothetical protein AQZ59_00072 [Trueperella bernardiae]|uniref:ABC transmembrane type-1 domain-containing protein n=2 Tax=Trueperella bernardiae TaxID=59561 RepID=A0A0W1KLG2_9ACTO|nr:hypothetical protein AQZ59_00072 [Trueperella bernardiae]